MRWRNGARRAGRRGRDWRTTPSAATSTAACWARWRPASGGADAGWAWRGRRWLGLAGSGEWGWTGARRAGPWLGVGLAWGLAAMAGFGLVELAGGSRTPQGPASALAGIRLLGIAAGSALAVAAIEETLFRGLLLGSIRRAGTGAATAAWFSALVYAAAHFVTRADWPGPVQWASGIGVLALSGARFLTGDALLPGFLTLTVAGLVLALARERSGGLWLPAGLHAGWVLGLKLFHGLTRATSAASRWDGWLMLGLLLGTGGVLWRILPPNGAGASERGLNDEPSREELA